MSEIKINKLAKLIEIFDEMSANLNLGRLSNAEKDVLLSIGKNIQRTWGVSTYSIHRLCSRLRISFTFIVSNCDCLFSSN